MGLWFDSFQTDLLVAIVILIVFAILYTRYAFSHWTRNGITQMEPSFPFGNLKKVILKQESMGMSFKAIYDHFKSLNQPFGGFYKSLKPELILLDPEIIKKVMVKDFNHFVDRDSFNDEKINPLTANLFGLHGTQWRQMRTKLTPTFTSGKMKMMFHTVVACSEELKNILEEKSMKSEPLDIRDYLARFTTDVIGSCAFGINCNCLKNPNTDFRKYGVMPFEPQGTIDTLRQVGRLISPNMMKFFKISPISKEMTNFFINIVKETVKYREDNNVVRKDFLQLLLQLKNQGKVADDEDDLNVKKNGEVEEGKGLTIEQIVAQCFVFFLAGFETSSTTMTFCLYELVKNPKIQEKVRHEINTVLNKYNGELTYEGVMEMHYLDKVINEALRKYPPLPFLVRRCTQDYPLPTTDYIIRKGDVVRISVLGLQRDAQFYPDPERFDPERFSEEEKAKRPQCTFLPFGDGPRVCIGLRFGVMQAKVGLSALLKNYRFTLNDKTKEPITMNPKSLILATQGGMWLDAHKVTD